MEGEPDLAAPRARLLEEGRGLERLGLVWDVRTPGPDQLARRAIAR